LRPNYVDFRTTGLEPSWVRQFKSADKMVLTIFYERILCEESSEEGRNDSGLEAKSCQNSSPKWEATTEGMNMISKRI
jgi:hypothetical protein